MSETTQTTTEPETQQQTTARFGRIEIHLRPDLSVDRVQLATGDGKHDTVYFDQRQTDLENHPHYEVVSHEELFTHLFDTNERAWDWIGFTTTDLYDLFKLDRNTPYYYNHQHIPPHLRHISLPKDPIAIEFFIRHPEQKIPDVLIPQVMAGRIKPFVKKQLELLPDANANHATIYKLLLHQWLTASLDEANFTLERAAIFEKILAYGIDQFSADVSASQVWGGVLSPTAYRQPATGNWTLSYPDGDALATDDTMLANAGLASDPNSNYSKAYSIVYPPTEPLGRGD